MFVAGGGHGHSKCLELMTWNKALIEIRTNSFYKKGLILPCFESELKNRPSSDLNKICYPTWGLYCLYCVINEEVKKKERKGKKTKTKQNKKRSHDCMRALQYNYTWETPPVKILSLQNKTKIIRYFSFFGGLLCWVC